nr:unnamed protein product [Callosobruchus analis]
MRLTVRRLAETDFGNYRCVAKNALGEAEGSIRLYGKKLFRNKLLIIGNQDGMYIFSLVCPVYLVNLTKFS